MTKANKKYDDIDLRTFAEEDAQKPASLTSEQELKRVSLTMSRLYETLALAGAHARVLARQVPKPQLSPASDWFDASKSALAESDEALAASHPTAVQTAEFIVRALPAGIIWGAEKAPLGRVRLVSKDTSILVFISDLPWPCMQVNVQRVFPCSSTGKFEFESATIFNFTDLQTFLSGPRGSPRFGLELADD